MAHFKIKKGYDIRLEGRPEKRMVNLTAPRNFSVCPAEFPGIKSRLRIAVGDSVKRGTLLFEDKKDERLVFRSPCRGVVTAIERGERRFPNIIRIEHTEPDEQITFDPIADVTTMARENLIAHLLDSGLWSLIRQRPFDRMADPDRAPKAIFVNAAGTAPFQADFDLILPGSEADFQFGLAALTKLTDGPVHLCRMDTSTLPDFKQVQNHTFSGRHPAGNTSVHINCINPILPHDTIYTVAAQDVIQIGKLLRTGELPRHKIIVLGGPAVKPEYRCHYRVSIGASLRPLLDQALEDGEVRIIAGTVLHGEIVDRDVCVRSDGSEFFALHEDRSRHLLGWTMPGLFQYSTHRVNLSSLLPSKRWKLGTNLHGSRRSMVITGWMDRYQPLNIMTDPLIRAVLAGDSDEAIQLGILETVPEDFALAAFTDPHKTDLCGIIAHGLQEIEREGL